MGLSTLHCWLPLRTLRRTAGSPPYSLFWLTLIKLTRVNNLRRKCERISKDLVPPAPINTVLNQYSFNTIYGTDFQRGYIKAIPSFKKRQKARGIAGFYYCHSFNFFTMLFFHFDRKVSSPLAVFCFCHSL